MPDDDFIDFRCPHCQESASFPAVHSGTAQECPACLEPVVVPDASTEYGGKVPIPIKTERLILRRLRGTDWKDFLEFMSDEELFELIDGNPLDEQGVERWLQEDREARLTQTDRWFILGVEEASAQKLVGSISLAYTDAARRQLAVNVLIHRRYQRQGLGSEAVLGLLGMGFAGLGLHRVVASCDSRNIAAARMLEKAGLRREGEFIQDRHFRGGWVNTVHYARLAKESAGA